ncbi:hypothetical protein TURU_101637 [Turdus rufiventris]|nr:hypothetical protein TURU_101637 [Turdus rufiventris]
MAAGEPQAKKLKLEQKQLRSEALQCLQKTMSDGFNKDGCTIFILPYGINLNLSCDYHKKYSKYSIIIKT